VAQRRRDPFRVLIACLLSFLREIFLAVATPRHAPALPPRRA